MNTEYNAARIKSRQLAKQFWDSILNTEVELNRRFHFLNSNWNEFLKAIAKDLGCDTTEFKPRVWMDFINEKLEVGINDKSTAKSIGVFSISYHKTQKEFYEKNNKKITTEALCEKGYTLEKYKKVLYEMSQYYAAISGLKIPEEVLKMSGIEVKIPNPIKFDDDDLVDLPCDKFLVAFIIDTGLSMTKVVPKLQNGLSFLVDLIKGNERLRQPVELYVTTTGLSDTCLLPFSSIRKGKDYSSITSFRADGPSRMAEALKRTVKAIYDREKTIKNAQFQVYCPWIVVISQGKWAPGSNQDIEDVVRMISEGVAAKKFKIFVRSLSEREELTPDRIENLAKLDPKFEAMRHEKAFFTTAFQSMCNLVKQSPSCGQGVDLPNSNGI